jgi:hypothetical protein
MAESSLENTISTYVAVATDAMLMYLEQVRTAPAIAASPADYSTSRSGWGWCETSCRSAFFIGRCSVHRTCFCLIRCGLTVRGDRGCGIHGGSMICPEHTAGSNGRYVLGS